MAPQNLCFNKANESGIRTARLPIGRYLASLPTRKVLTVNQVFEILVKWVETKDWEEALHSVVPKRKFQTGGKGTSEGSPTGDPEDAEVEAAAEEEIKEGTDLPPVPLKDGLDSDGHRLVPSSEIT